MRLSNRSLTIAVAFAGLALARSASAQTTFTTGDAAVAIPDNTGTLTACQNISVTGMGAITDANISVAASHSWIGDLTIRVVAPGSVTANTLMVLNRPGRTGTGAGASDDLQIATPISYDDEAVSVTTAETMGAGCAGIIGSTTGCPDNYTPSPDAADTPITGLGTNLAQFDGRSGADVNGTWTLCMADSASGDTGTLSSWSLTLTGAAVCSLTCPANITTANDANQCGATVNYPAPTASGTCGTITCTPASGSFFGVGGATAVNCTSAQGGGACGFTVTVNDTQPPAISCPADINLTATSPSGATATFPLPTVSDNCPGVGTPSCAPPSGSLFPVATTSVSCSVADTTTNTANCGFNVAVAAQPSVLEIPTVSEKGLLLLALLLAGAAFVTLRRS